MPEMPPISMPIEIPKPKGMLPKHISHPEAVEKDDDAKRKKYAQMSYAERRKSRQEMLWEAPKLEERLKKEVDEKWNGQINKQITLVDEKITHLQETIDKLPEGEKKLFNNLESLGLMEIAISEFKKKIKDLIPAIQQFDEGVSQFPAQGTPEYEALEQEKKDAALQLLNAKKHLVDEKTETETKLATAEDSLQRHYADIDLPDGLITNITGRLETKDKDRVKELCKQQNVLNAQKSELESKKKKLPENLNMSLVFIQEFQRHVREAQVLRKVVQSATDPKEKALALSQFGAKRNKIQEYLDYGPGFEAAYREYVRSWNDYVEFDATLREITRLEQTLANPEFQSIQQFSHGKRKGVGENPSVREEALLVNLSETGNFGSPLVEDPHEMAEALKMIYPEDSSTYKQIVLAIKEAARAKTDAEQEAATPLAATKKQVRERIGQLQGKLKELWDDHMVRHFWELAEFEKLIADLAQGKEVIETQQVIHILNKLYEWETLHQNTTVGGVLVGPPGVGKTTTFHHFLELMGRKYVYIDLSEDVTRYMLYGSKDTVFAKPMDHFRQLADHLEGLDVSTFKSFVQDHATAIKKTFRLTDDEAAVVLINQIQEEIASVREEDVNGVLSEKLKLLKAKVTGLAKKAFQKELAGEFSHAVKKNGWRDGVIIAALRRGESIILDEFPKNKNWTLIYGLMTATPGKKWYFADNDEWIDIPPHWRMYFAGNIGRRHGSFPAPEAFASRAEGKVLEVPYPPARDEIRLALATLANAEGDFLRPTDLAKLFITIHELIPKVRDFINDPTKKQTLPISYRTIRNLGEKLVLKRDPKSSRMVYKPTNAAFNEALWEVLVESYTIHEDKVIPAHVVKLATSMGLFLDDAFKQRITAMNKFMTTTEFEKLQQTFAKPENIKSMNDIVNQIRGISRGVETLTMPGTRNFATSA